MDWIECKNTVVAYLKKYRYILAAVLAGVLLMLLPSGTKEEKAVQQPYTRTDHRFRTLSRKYSEAYTALGR